MDFHAKAGDELDLASVRYRFAEHPGLPGSSFAYAQEGRTAVVYQLQVEDGSCHALKVFKPQYRQPWIVRLTRTLQSYSQVPGLHVAQRRVLAPRDDAALLRQHRDLTYAILMPWIQGVTWSDLVVSRQPLTAVQSVGLSREFASVLTGLEQLGLAHCDLSAANLIVNGLGTDAPPSVELVDIEQLYAPDMERPTKFPGGSPGYTPYGAGNENWGPDGDRFAGAVLLAEMLGWCDERVRDAADDSSYFGETELQQPVERYRLLCDVLEEHWGADVVALFRQVWQSKSPLECPSFGEWLVALPESPPARLEDHGKVIGRLMAEGKRLTAVGDLAGARAAYQEARSLTPGNSGLSAELAMMIDHLTSRSVHATPSAPVAPSGASRPCNETSLGLTLFGVFVLAIPLTWAWMKWREDVRPAGYARLTTLPTGLEVEQVWVSRADDVRLGSDSGEPDEVPVVRVALDAFWMDRYEVTVEQFAAFLNAKGTLMGDNRVWYELSSTSPIDLDSSFRPANIYIASHPATFVTWYGADAYCHWAGGRLPTETEWEYAAQGGDNNRYPWNRKGGNQSGPTCPRANLDGCAGRTRPVDELATVGQSWARVANLAGNVQEWTQDVYGRNTYRGWAKLVTMTSRPLRNPVNDGPVAIRVVRGGHFSTAKNKWRATDRYGTQALDGRSTTGFRCVYDR